MTTLTTPFKKYTQADIRNLLTFAAIAADVHITGWAPDCDATTGFIEVAVLSDGRYWQPFQANCATDYMGDALRLAVKLKLDINGQHSLDHSRVTNDEIAAIELDKSDADSATCRAIVRVAAKMGERISAQASSPAITVPTVERAEAAKGSVRPKVASALTLWPDSRIRQVFERIYAGLDLTRDEVDMGYAVEKTAFVFHIFRIGFKEAVALQAPSSLLDKLEGWQLWSAQGHTYDDDGDSVYQLWVCPGEKVEDLLRKHLLEDGNCDDSETTHCVSSSCIGSVKDGVFQLDPARLPATVY